MRQGRNLDSTDGTQIRFFRDYKMVNRVGFELTTPDSLAHSAEQTTSLELCC
jgi:hypothetical protein